jgi:hypothetical protein
VTSWHLRHLATFGLVLDAEPDEVPGDRRHRWWKAAAPGFRFDVGPGDEAAAAGRILADQLYRAARDHVDRWLAEAEPALDGEWLRVAGVSNTSVRLTADELERLSAAMDELLGRYVNRADAEAPEGARRVRVLRHYLPEAR